MRTPDGRWTLRQSRFLSRHHPALSPSPASRPQPHTPRSGPPLAQKVPAAALALITSLSTP